MGTLGIVDFRYEVPTNTLQPEKSRNIEVGYKIQANKWAGSLSGYHMQLNNLITRVKVEGEQISGYPVYRKENVEEGFIKGLETEVIYQPITALQFKANLAYAYGQSLTKNEPLRRIPPINGRFISSYNLKKWFASAELLFASAQQRLALGDKDDNRIPKGGTPGWEVINIFGGFQLPHVKINLGLQNLFNIDYRTHGSGINGVGRSAWISFSLQL
jgi:outer membrane receptor protein involved in Fe transport